jgi:hypothetical protein
VPTVGAPNAGGQPIWADRAFCMLFRRPRPQASTSAASILKLAQVRFRFAPPVARRDRARWTGGSAGLGWPDPGGHGGLGPHPHALETPAENISERKTRKDQKILDGVLRSHHQTKLLMLTAGV